MTVREYFQENWDTGAFWIPTADRRGVFLFLFLVLFVLHFDELFGLHMNDTLLFGAVPIEFVYQIGTVFLNIGFLYILYQHWPEPPEHVFGGDADG